MRVLVIDDSRAMRMILRSTLAKLGHQAVEAADGKQGLEQLRSEGPFPVALVDWNMPVMNGLEFVQAVRAGEEDRGLKIVMVTSEVEMSQVARAMEAGADEYVMKPFTAEILAEKLAMLAA